MERSSPGGGGLFFEQILSVMNLLETINYRDHEIKIYRDDNADSPNNWDCTSAFLLYNHRNFATSPHGVDPRKTEEVFDVWTEGAEIYVFEGIEYWIFPVHSYIHSGVSLYLSRNQARNSDPMGFDVSFKGFCLINSDEFNDSMSAKVEAEKLINAWNEYLSGDIYGYVSDAGSCWGFYGEDGKKQMISDAKNEIDSLILNNQRKRQRMLKTFILHNVPIEKRQTLLAVQ